MADSDEERGMKGLDQVELAVQAAVAHFGREKAKEFMLAYLGL